MVDKTKHSFAYLWVQTLCVVKFVFMGGTQK